MTTRFLADDIEREEGRKPGAYPDPLSALGKACTAAGLRLKHYRELPGWRDLSGAPWTIGVGHTGPEVHQGLVWTDAQIDAALAADIQAVADALDRALPWWRALAPARQDVLVQMAFQMGVAGLLAFRTTLARVRAGVYAPAAAGMMDSLWARQTPKRARRLADQMRDGMRAADARAARA